jgi:hypothetical protein
MKIKVFLLYSTNEVKSQNRLKTEQLKKKELINVKVGMIKFTPQFKALFKICYCGLSKTLET